MKDISLFTIDGPDLYPFTPEREPISIETIALGLSNTCRYGGQVRHFYSVAQHSVIVSEMVSPEFALWGLLHDAAETWIGDIPAPLRDGMCWQFDGVLYGIDAVERQILNHVADTFGLEPGIPQEVHEADMEIRIREQRSWYVCGKNRWWRDGLTEPWRPGVTHDIFLDRFENLTKTET